MPAVTERNGDGQPGDTPMDRISFILHQLSGEFSSSDKITDEARTLLRQAREVVDGHDDYMTEMSSPAPPIVEKMVKDGYAKDWAGLQEQGKTMYKLIPQMTAGGYEAVVLQQLARATKAERILEIGTFTGTTTVALALVSSVKHIVALEIEPYLKENNEPFFKEAGVADKVDMRIGDALKALDKLEEEQQSFDMIFIDADKPAYLKYYHKILSGSLLAKHGMILADNTAYKASPWAPDRHYLSGSAIHDFNRAVRDDARVDVIMLPIEDGISLIRRAGE
ncbi:uncharacterized protein L969DRAFT_69527 [Mixia osmundae IAM 14324]|uniref:Caffeoyl-CoA O-methyltransferase n=1 Tax=Mixia osmundae (strain CBS 9802 / IAM 14324 / JCM 22182 / KY 12970) TaxID=764103 RepID=G7E376_MIXOS|nr:uncharacterized protein L969DRAFT_69527 [Mixia osmundae IAM 14324]KEI42454.1 hypothetical protein L969DRAFT_69527 [Mixia osmundae IAM 14324]GAA97257.1 hypothetical protein E5Q_03934 [Mixia osmundae IAM 14324]